MVEFNIPYEPLVSQPARVSSEESDIEKPIIPMGELGGSVTEGQRFGSFIQSAQGAFRTGAKKLELATIMGGGEPGGAESYGKHAREALREMAKVTESEFVSTHTPTQVGNLSGFNPQQRNFDDDMRKKFLDEVKRAIDFAGDVAGGGAVVVHTGEFQRNISDQRWAEETMPDGTKRKMLLGYMEEPGKAATYLVDERDGRVISDIRKNKPIRIPKFNKAEDDHWGEDTYGNRVKIRKGDWVDQDGRFIDPSDPDAIFYRVPKWNSEKTEFETELVGWDEVEKMTQWFNERRIKEQGKTPISPEEYMFRLQMETQMLQYKGSSLFYADRYEKSEKERTALKDALTFYEKLEKNTPKEELWKLMAQDRRVQTVHGGEFTGHEQRLPTEIIKEGIKEAEFRLKHIREASASADARAADLRDQIDHTVKAEDYGKKRSFTAFAEAAMHAMDITRHNPHVKKDIFVAPENIFPEMGFGSHPEEMIELVKGSRKAFVDMVTSPEIENPYGILDTKTQTLKKMANPYYRKDISKEEAAKLAERHIKATLDTQHLGMWKKHFVPKPGETPQEWEKRFNGWYMEQIEKLEKEKIIGHIHMVDAMGAGHHHLPIGQGTLPIKDAIEYLKKKGYTGTMITEGHEENARFGTHRQFTEMWRHFGSPVYGTFAPTGPTWGQVQHAYFGYTMPPMFIYGAYSPSNEWKLWSEVPME